MKEAWHHLEALRIDYDGYPVTQERANALHAQLRNTRVCVALEIMHSILRLGVSRMH